MYSIWNTGIQSKRCSVGRNILCLKKRKVIPQKEWKQFVYVAKEEKTTQNQDSRPEGRKQIKRTHVDCRVKERKVHQKGTKCTPVKMNTPIKWMNVIRDPKKLDYFVHFIHKKWFHKWRHHQFWWRKIKILSFQVRFGQEKPARHTCGNNGWWSVMGQDYRKLVYKVRSIGPRKWTEERHIHVSYTGCGKRLRTIHTEYPSECVHLPSDERDGLLNKANWARAKNAFYGHFGQIKCEHKGNLMLSSVWKKKFRSTKSPIYWTIG